MTWRLKTVVLLVLVIFVTTCLWLGYAVHARYQGNEYVMELGIAFNAAALLNGEETYTDPDRAVVSAYEGQQYVILPENYKALVSLLRKDHAMPLFRRVGKDAPLAITICDCTTIQAEPDGEDGALVCLVTDAGKRFTMHVRGGNIWKQLVEYATAGHGERLNIAL